MVPSFVGFFRALTYTKAKVPKILQSMLGVAITINRLLCIDMTMCLLRLLLFYCYVIVLIAIVTLVLSLFLCYFHCLCDFNMLVVCYVLSLIYLFIIFVSYVLVDLCM